jgi:serine/threonine-protein kinase RsbW
MGSFESEGKARLELVLPASAEMLSAVRKAVVGFARSVGAEEECVQAVAVAVNEAASNVVVHAYPRGGTRPLHVVADTDTDHDKLVVTISDEGPGDASGPRVRGESGRGLPLMRALADEVDVYRGPRGTRARMTFALHPHAA